MRLPSILVAFILLLALPALAQAAPPPSGLTSGAPAAASAPAPAAPSVGAFLASLDRPAAAPAASCGPGFCTSAERTACNQQCEKQGHRFFVGLECCSNCTTICICGSVPVNC